MQVRAALECVLLGCCSEMLWIRNGIKVAYVMPVNHFWYGPTEFSTHLQINQENAPGQSFEWNKPFFSNFDFLSTIVDIIITIFVGLHP